jgi:hypothetical protein
MREGRIKCIIFFINAKILGVSVKIEYLRYLSPTTSPSNHILIRFNNVFTGLLLQQL